MTAWLNIDRIIPAGQRKRVIVRGRWRGVTQRWVQCGIAMHTIVLLDDGTTIMCGAGEMQEDPSPPVLPSNVVDFAAARARRLVHA